MASDFQDLLCFHFSGQLEDFESHDEKEDGFQRSVEEDPNCVVEVPNEEDHVLGEVVHG